MEGVIEPLAVTVKGACALTGVSRSTVYELIGSGAIEASKAGARTLVSVDSIRRWLASLPRINGGVDAKAA